MLGLLDYGGVGSKGPCFVYIYNYMYIYIYGICWVKLRRTKHEPQMRAPEMGPHFLQTSISGLQIGGSTLGAHGMDWQDVGASALGLKGVYKSFEGLQVVCRVFCQGADGDLCGYLKFNVLDTGS